MATKNRYYPHLLQESIDLWELFLAEHKTEYLGFDYDVRVGVGRDPGDKYRPNIRQMAVDLSQRRIDVIGHRRDRLDIIEITPYAGIKAMGQLAVYPILFHNTFPQSKRIQPVLITSDISPDIVDHIAAQQIIVYTY